jgi:hypothetical protein
MLQTKNWIVFTAGAAASVFLALFASSPIAVADTGWPGNPPQCGGAGEASCN